MIKNFVKETASAPGTATTFNLGGATAPFVSFASVFSSGATMFYFMIDATQWETGVGTLTHGSPNTLTRTTVLANSAGSTARLNFAGTTTVLNEVPGQNVVYANASGRVGINTTASIGMLDLRGPTGEVPMVRLRNGGLAQGSIDIYKSDASARCGRMLWYDNGLFHLYGASDTEALYVDTNAYLHVDNRLYVNGATFAARLSVLGDGSVSPIVTETSGTSLTIHVGFVNGNGSVGNIATNGSATSYNTSSDYRLKRLHGPADPSFIHDLKVHDAEFVDGSGRYPMLVAHEVQEAGAAFAVTGEKDGETMQMVDYSKLVPALIAAVQMLRAEVETLRQRLDRMDGSGAE